ncbi:hypothetical protein CGRA01v4_11390 [Colletotrichum graminicola]|nr:hypothetical protein CGRA01v4_11390 [Colletotrichum graminicola]
MVWRFPDYVILGKSRRTTLLDNAPAKWLTTHCACNRSPRGSATREPETNPQIDPENQAINASAATKFGPSEQCRSRRVPSVVPHATRVATPRTRSSPNPPRRARPPRLKAARAVSTRRVIPTGTSPTSAASASRSSRTTLLSISASSTKRMVTCCLARKGSPST